MDTSQAQRQHAREAVGVGHLGRSAAVHLDVQALASVHNHPGNELGENGRQSRVRPS